MGAALLLLPQTANADRISDLTRTLRSAKYHKSRIAAAVSLGRIKSRRTLAPLVYALRDSNRTVRIIAATALGALGDPAALPALRLSSRDSDRLVRKRSMEAIAKIRNRRALRRNGYRLRNQHHEERPRLFVVFKSARDETAGRLSKRVRKHRARKMRSLMIRQLWRTPDITLSKTQAKRYKLPPHRIHVSITKLRPKTRGAFVEVECNLRVAISNQRGKMTSVLSGGAKVQVPRKTFKREYLKQLRLEALENAVKGVHQDLLRHLRRNNS